MKVIWFHQFKKYPATINHIGNEQNLPVCGVRLAYPAERLEISGNIEQVTVDCRLCNKWWLRAKHPLIHSN